MASCNWMSKFIFVVLVKVSFVYALSLECQTHMRAMDAMTCLQNRYHPGVLDNFAMV